MPETYFDKFFLNDLVINFISLLIILVFITIGHVRRMRQGYAESSNQLVALFFFIVQTSVDACLAGFGLANSDIFFAVRRLFILPGLLFVFLYFLEDYEDGNLQPQHKHAKTILLVVFALQMTLNVLWLVSLSSQGMIFRLPSSLDTLRNILFLVIVLGLAFVTWRGMSRLNTDVKSESRSALKRYTFLFLVLAIIPMLLIARGRLSLSDSQVGLFTSLGLMIIFTGATVIHAGSRREPDLLVTRVSLLISLALFLLLGLITYLVSNSLVSDSGVPSDPQVLARAMRPFLIVQAALVLVHLFVLPRILRLTLPEYKVEDQTPKTLTPRQREVMRLLADEKSNQQIALELNITVSTVKNHVTILMKTLEAPNRYRLGWIARSMLQKKEL
ncbi:MAG: response regulator transcription factor [Chloroflexi bacterium]|nr:response regulator transcription factor [Chloroflexota bacterium]